MVLGKYIEYLGAGSEDLLVVGAVHRLHAGGGLLRVHILGRRLLGASHEYAERGNDGQGEESGGHDECLLDGMTGRPVARTREKAVAARANGGN